MDRDSFLQVRERRKNRETKIPPDGYRVQESVRGVRGVVYAADR